MAMPFSPRSGAASSMVPRASSAPSITPIPPPTSVPDAPHTATRAHDSPPSSDLTQTEVATARPDPTTRAVAIVRLRLRRCVEEELRQNPEFSAKIEFQEGLDSSGRFQPIVRSETAAPAFASCVARAFSGPLKDSDAEGFVIAVPTCFCGGK